MSSTTAHVRSTGARNFHSVRKWYGVGTVAIVWRLPSLERVRMMTTPRLGSPVSRGATQGPLCVAGEVGEFRVLAVLSGFQNGEGVLIDRRRRIERLEVFRPKVRVQLRHGCRRIGRCLTLGLVLKLEL